MIIIRFLLVVCGLLVVCLFPQTANAKTLHAYNISQEGCEHFQEGYLSQELWYKEKMQIISGIEFLLDRADSFTAYIDEDYNVDVDSIIYISEAQKISDWLEEIVEEGEVARHNATVSNTGSNGSGVSNGNSYGSSSGGLTQSGGVYNYGGRRETYYSSRVLYHYRTPEWTADAEGFYRDANGYYVVAASDFPQGTVFQGSKGMCKVYDSGCAAGTTDYYVNF